MLEEQNRRRINGGILDFAHSWALLDFLGIIGCSKNPDIFTVDYPGYWATFGKFS